ncbi:ABC transporter substrate-binding protein [Sphingomonas crusticola]|uniref:ABC transporter substrate-binding protein n=1 Tax=Sphingomonas crusticola TaxID=1697973 RepID=UPI000E27DAFE|nr:sugar ABC transporter substrate-binding protein [Sphingomonas crusticola]
MKRIATILLAAALSSCSGGNRDVTTLTVATVNNSDMVRLKGLSSAFTKAHPNIRLNWVTLEENVLRQRVTTDVATRGGQFDVITIGSYEVPIWAQRRWLLGMDDLGPSYRADDLLPAIRDALSAKGVLYAAPINGEGSFTMYRTDLFAKAKLVMPQHPSWDFIATAAKKLNDPAHGVYGICLRGKAGWGENMATIVAMSNSFGARLFDEHWRPQFDTPEWKRTLSVYVDLARNAGPPGMIANGFNESLALYAAGKCAIWFDSTVAAPFVTDPKTSVVADKTGFAAAPDAGLGRTANWLWTWALAIPASTTKAKAAKSFVAWATGPDYAKLVAGRFGWAAAPPGTRTSLYANPAYRKAAPFAEATLEAIGAADTHHPTVKPVPYVGVQYAAIPEFQGLGTEVGQQFSGAVAGTMTVDQALDAAQTSSKRQMAAASRQ